MNRSLPFGLLGLTIAITLTACGRHVVIETELIGTRNQTDWTVHSEPTATPAPSATESADSNLPPPPAPPAPPASGVSDNP